MYILIWGELASLLYCVFTMLSTSMNIVYFSIYLVLSISFIRLRSLQHTSPMHVLLYLHLHDIYYKYNIFKCTYTYYFWVIKISIVFLILVSACSLEIYRRTIDFCILWACWACILWSHWTHLLVLGEFFVNVLVFFYVGNHVIFKYSFISSFPIFMPLISFL